MKTMNIIKKAQIDDFLLIYEKTTSISHFLNQKRFKLDDDYTEVKTKKMKNKKCKYFLVDKKDKLDNFLETYEQIINDLNNDNDDYYLKSKKYYFKNIFNLTLLKIIINYYSKMKPYLRNANIFNSKELIDLIKTFQIDDIEFSILTLLIEDYISNYSIILEKETIYYLGLYSKYISSEFYHDIFYKMINSNLFFKKWYLHYKDFLQCRDLSLLRINKRNNSFKPNNQKCKMIDYNLMVDNLFNTKKEENVCKNIDNKNNIFNSNIGKKIKVIIVYQEDESQDNNTINNKPMDKDDLSKNETEGLPTDMSA